VTKKGTKPPAAHIQEALRWLSAQTASKGGKARWEGVSAAERTAHAKKAVAAREAKRAAKGKKKG